MAESMSPPIYAVVGVPEIGRVLLYDVINGSLENPHDLINAEQHSEPERIATLAVDGLMALLNSMDDRGMARLIDEPYFSQGPETKDLVRRMINIAQSHGSVLRIAAPRSPAYVGNFGIAQRKATEYELIRFHELRSRRSDLPRPTPRADLQEVSQTPQQLPEDLTGYDHVRIWREDGQSFILPLSTPDAIVAARVLGVLADRAKTISSIRKRAHAVTDIREIQEISILHLTRRVNRQMPEAERALTATREWQLASKNPLRGPIVRTLNELAVSMGLVRSAGSKDYLMTKNIVGISASMEPYEDRDGDRQRPISILPPEIASQDREPTPSERESFEASASILLEELLTGQPTRMGLETSIRVLDLLMSDAGKRILLAAHANQATVDDFSSGEVLERAHGLLRRVLGEEGYITAVEQRTIARFSASHRRVGRVALTGGDMPARTVNVFAGHGRWKFSPSRS